MEPRKVPSYLVDNDLSPDIAKALGLFDFDITHIQLDPQFRNRPEGVLDPEIIDWCRENGRVWITEDKRARKRHEVQMKSSRISVLWLYGPSKAFPAWLQFKIVVRVIDETHRLLQSAHGAMHFRAGVRGGPRPKVIWTELASDMPHEEP